MFKRIAIALIVAAALFGVFVVLFEKYEEAVEDGYRTARMGRRLQDRASSGDLKTAEEKFQEALGVFRRLYHAEGEARTLNDLGNLYADRRQYSKAVEYYEKSLDIKRRNKWTQGQGNTLACLGLLHAEQHQYPKAAEYFEQAAMAYENVGYTESAAEYLEKSAAAYMELRDYPKAIDCLVKSFQMAKRTNDLKNEARALGTLGAVKDAQGQYSTAVKYLEESAMIAKKIGDAKLENWALHFLGTVYEDWKRIDPGNSDLKRVKGLLGQKDTSNEALLDAIMISDIEAAEAALAKGANVNEVSKSGELPLEVAAQNGSFQIMKVLLDEGADLETRNRYGRPALEAAFTVSMLNRHEEVAEYLLHIGADVNAMGPAGRSALECAATGCSLELVRLLLDKGADVNGKSNDGSTALMAAARLGKVETTQLLLDKGADINATNKDGGTALTEVALGLRYSSEDALRHDYLKIANLFLDRGAEINVMDTRFHGAGPTALAIFSIAGSPEVVKLLLERGADVNTISTDAATVLMWAINRGICHTNEILKCLGPSSHFDEETLGQPLDRALNDRQIEVVKLLLDHNANVNAALSDGTTALMWAAILGQTGMVKLLLERGVDLDATLDDGSKALKLAELNGRSEVAKILLEREAAGGFSDVEEKSRKSR